MITDTFDNKSEEIIKVCRSDSAIKVDACILTFSHVILKYVLETFQCKKIGDLYSSNGANPVYVFEYENRCFAVYMSCVGAPACVADMEDTLSIINTDKYVVFGGSGCLNKDIARGKVMVPTDGLSGRGNFIPLCTCFRLYYNQKCGCGGEVYGDGWFAFCERKNLDNRCGTQRNQCKF